MGYSAIGADETNHGRYPEIHVAVPALHSLDLQPNMVLNRQGTKLVGGLNKRVSKDAKIEDVLGGRDYRFIHVPEDVGRLVTPKGVQLVVLCEFADAFEDLELILVDGQLSERVIEGVRSFAYHRKGLQIKPVPHGDGQYPVVNVAHRVASLFYRDVIQGKNPRLLEETAGKVIVPDLRRYEKPLKQFS